MTVEDLLFVLNHVKRPRDVNVVIEIDEYRAGMTPAVGVLKANIGIDWDHNRVILVQNEKLIKRN